MSSVDKIFEFIKQFEEIEQLNILATKRQSELDVELSSFYHRVEGTTIKHVSESHKFIKELKIILDKRRLNKLEVILLHSTCDTLRDKVKILKENKKNIIAKNQEILTEIKARANE